MYVPTIYKLLFVISICVFVIYSRRTVLTESFEEDMLFYILQQKNSVFKIDTIPNDARVGYLNENDKKLFKSILQANQLDISQTKHVYIKRKEIDFSNLDIFLYSGSDTVVSTEGFLEFVPITYFPSLPEYTDLFLKDYVFDLILFETGHIFLINTSKKKTHVLVPEPLKESVGKTSMFQIEGEFNGTYTQRSMNDDEILLVGKQISGINVLVGDTVLIKDNPREKVDGLYSVITVGKNIVLNKKVDPNIPEKVCVDENMVEQSKYVTKDMCENELDVIGEEKKLRMVWDSRCVRDFECPFYRDDNKMDCESGYCKLPVSVTRASYKKYVEEPKILPTRIFPRPSDTDVDFLDVNIFITTSLPHFEYDVDTLRKMVENMSDTSVVTVVDNLNKTYKFDPLFYVVHFYSSGDNEGVVIYRDGKPFGFYIETFPKNTPVVVKGIVQDSVIFQLRTQVNS
jgi:hypothetical protein